MYRIVNKRRSAASSEEAHSFGQKWRFYTFIVPTGRREREKVLTADQIIIFLCLHAIYVTTSTYNLTELVLGKHNITLFFKTPDSTVPKT